MVFVIALSAPSPLTVLSSSIGAGHRWPGSSVDCSFLWRALSLWWGHFHKRLAWENTIAYGNFESGNQDGIGRSCRCVEIVLAKRFSYPARHFRRKSCAGEIWLSQYLVTAVIVCANFHGNVESLGPRRKEWLMQKCNLHQTLLRRFDKNEVVLWLGIFYLFFLFLVFSVPQL